ncbi:hypothetical protein [uncultured Azohydromonas sp.]|jgi:hypothetical protein|uniref:hypothetical protein n=1 Tax=uncultured Azohydromonas sp. TaxID=487342 RepID=UPI002637D752|nr:hypothetical protein [uncultured Azohydromonas sp.]
MPALIPNCQVPEEYETLLRDRGFVHETSAAGVLEREAPDTDALPAPVVFRSPHLDLRFVWKRGVEAQVGPPGAGGNQWLALEPLILFVTGQPAHGNKGRPLPAHEYCAAGLAKHFEKIATAVSAQQIENTRQAIKKAADESFKKAFANGRR